MVGQERSYLNGDVIRGTMKSKDLYKDVYGSDPSKYGGTKRLHRSIEGGEGDESIKYKGNLTTPFSQTKLRAPSFGHRPSSASRHFDLISMTVNRGKTIVDDKKRGALLSSRDLEKLMRSATNGVLNQNPYIEGPSSAFGNDDETPYDDYIATDNQTGVNDLPDDNIYNLTTQNIIDAESAKAMSAMCLRAQQNEDVERKVAMKKIKNRKIREAISRQPVNGLSSSSIPALISSPFYYENAQTPKYQISALRKPLQGGSLLYAGQATPTNYDLIATNGDASLEDTIKLSRPPDKNLVKLENMWQSSVIIPPVSRKQAKQDMYLPHTIESMNSRLHRYAERSAGIIHSHLVKEKVDTDKREAASTLKKLYAIGESLPPHRSYIDKSLHSSTPRESNTHVHDLFKEVREVESKNQDSSHLLRLKETEVLSEVDCESVDDSYYYDDVGLSY
jgi:hypothetical protein